MTLDEIKHHLADRKPGKVAEATGLHVNTIRNIRDGLTPNPSIQVVDKLRAYLESRIVK